MGAIMNKSVQSKLQEDLLKINQITTSDLFYMKTYINLKFSCSLEDLNFVQKIVYSKIILVELVSLAIINFFR